VGSDKREAVYWFRKAAVQGHTVAQAFLQGSFPSSTDQCPELLPLTSGPTDTTWQLNQQNICAWE
jgi:TPR repeat protein